MNIDATAGLINNFHKRRSTTHLTEVKTILSVRSGRAIHLCLEGGTYTDYYAVLNERIYTTPLPGLCSIASHFYYRRNVEAVDTFITICAVDQRRRNGDYYEDSIC